MRISEWVKPGMKFKRWILLCLLGVMMWGSSVMVLLERGVLGAWAYIITFVLMIFGAVALFAGIFFTIEALWRIIKPRQVIKQQKDISDMLYEQRTLGRGPHIVVIGGGTGLSTLLRGLKPHTSNLTAVVTVADDGGSSGLLRDDLGIIPPGDIRNCILALSDIEPIMERLFNQRFTEGGLKGQNFGNIFFAAMVDICNGSYDEAIQQMSNVLAVTGRVLPVTLADITLNAELENGEIVRGESVIPKAALEHNSPIRRVYLTPEDAEPMPDVIEAILDADMVVIGPGSLYTSIMPDLLIDGVAQAVRDSHALCLYCCNVMTQPGETDGFSVSGHIKALEKVIGPDVIDVVLANRTKSVPSTIHKRYLEDGADFVALDSREVEALGVRLIARDLVKASEGYVRHSTSALGNAVIDIWDDYVNRAVPK